MISFDFANDNFQVAKFYIAIWESMDCWLTNKKKNEKIGTCRTLFVPFTL